MTVGRGQTLAERIDALDAARFVGRADECAQIDRWLHPDTPAGVLVVAGEGGIGKSTLVRAALRSAVACGYQPYVIDGHSVVGADVRIVDEALLMLADAPRPILVIDTAEQATGLIGYLRRQLAEVASPGMRVIVAGRATPEALWFHDGWDHVTTIIRLGPLDDDTATALVTARGLTDPVAVRSLVEWASGLPLALAAGCEAGRIGASEGAAAPWNSRRQVVELIVSRLMNSDVDPTRLDVLLVASIAPVVDADLLAATLGDDVAETSMTWLRGLSFVESTGQRCRLHDRLRGLLASELERIDASRACDLRLGLADRLYERAQQGNRRALMELRDLMSVHDAHWAMADVGTLAYADRVRPGDLHTLGDTHAFASQPWWQRIVRWFEQAPEFVVAVRDQRHQLIGVGTWATDQLAPPWAADDAVLGPMRRHRATLASPGSTLYLVDVLDLTESDEGRSIVASAGNEGVIMRCGAGNIRHLYATTSMPRPGIDSFMKAVGFTALPEWDIALDGLTVRIHHLDHGPGGIADGTRRLVYESCGVTPPPSSGLRHIDVAELRTLLRSFHLRSTDYGDHERDEVRRAVDSLGDHGQDAIFKACLRRGYLDPDASHTTAYRELFLSRSTYFRRLAEATLRLAGVLAEGTGVNAPG